MSTQVLEDFQIYMGNMIRHYLFNTVAHEKKHISTVSLSGGCHRCTPNTNDLQVGSLILCFIVGVALTLVTRNAGIRAGQIQHKYYINSKYQKCNVPHRGCHKAVIFSTGNVISHRNILVLCNYQSGQLHKLHPHLQPTHTHTHSSFSLTVYESNKTD